jgi:hypothetical protein
VHRAQHLHLLSRVEAEAARQPVGHNLYHQVGDPVGILLDEQEEVGQAVGDRVLAGVDAVGVGDHPALLSLAKHVGQPDPGQPVSTQQIPEHLSCPDAGELVHVTDEQEVGTGWDGLDQLVGQQHIQHGGLVDHHQVGVQGMVAVKGGISTRAQLQQPMQGRGLQPGQLPKALGSPPGRRGQQDPGPFGKSQGHDRPHRVALATARPAGQHRHPLGQGQADRRLLLRRQGHAGRPAQPVQRDCPVHRLGPGQPIGRVLQQAQQPGGQRTLGPVERDQPDRPPRSLPDVWGHGGSREGLGDHALLGHQLLQAASGELGVDVEQLGCLGDQLGLGQVAVAVLSRLRQGELQAGPDPLGAVVRDAQAAGELVGGLEPDPPHVGGQPIRLPADNLDGVVAVGLVDPHPKRGGHPHPLQEDHDLLDGLLLGPGGGDHGGALGAEPRDLDQPARPLLDHLQGGRAEVVHDPLGHPGPDPLDQPRAQVAADSLDGCRQDGGVGLDLELTAVLGMAGPPAPQAQALPGLRSQQRTDHGQQITGTSGRHASDGVAGLLVGVGDPLQHRVQGRRWRRPRLLHERDCIARTRPCPVHACGPGPGGAVTNSDLLHASAHVGSTSAAKEERLRAS